MKKFKRVAIIGVGLIGGSIGLAIKKNRLADEVIGIGRHQNSIKKALKFKAIDRGTIDVQEGVSGAEFVIIATPVGAIVPVVRSIASCLKAETIITDTGSTKKEIVRQIENLLPPDIYFVGSHPMAGSEKHGVESAKPELFRDSVCLITKTPHTKRGVLQIVSQFWNSIGCSRVRFLSPSDHDIIIARVSHLPHIVATALVNSVDKKDLSFASGGFKDTTRIASSDPRMWVDICMSNSKCILKSLNKFNKGIETLRKAISVKDTKLLMAEFGRAKRMREKLIV